MGFFFRLSRLFELNFSIRDSASIQSPNLHKRIAKKTLVTSCIVLNKQKTKTHTTERKTTFNLNTTSYTNWDYLRQFVWPSIKYFFADVKEFSNDFVNVLNLVNTEWILCTTILKSIVELYIISIYYCLFVLCKYIYVTISLKS